MRKVIFDTRFLASPKNGYDEEFIPPVFLETDEGVERLIQQMQIFPFVSATIPALLRIHKNFYLSEWKFNSFRPDII
jgi:hypothetical protein